MSLFAHGTHRRGRCRAALHVVVLSSLLMSTGCSPQQLMQAVTSLAGGVAGNTSTATQTGTAGANPLAGLTGILGTAGNVLNSFGQIFNMRPTSAVQNAATPTAAPSLTNTGTGT